MKKRVVQQLWEVLQILRVCTIKVYFELLIFVHILKFAFVYGADVMAVKIVKEKNHLVVTGEGVDSVKLAKLLRKKFCFADIETVKKVESECETNESNQFLESQKYYKNIQTNIIHHPITLPIQFMIKIHPLVPSCDLKF